MKSNKQQKDRARLERRNFDPRPEQHQNQTSGRLYGLVPVLEALRAGNRQIQEISIAEGGSHERLKDLMDLARQKNIPIHRVPRMTLDRVLGEARHQGVFARIAAARYLDADDLLERLDQKLERGESPLAVGLDGIEDPRNVGAVLRTAECTGVDAVFIPERRAAGLTDTVAKAAAGALEYVPVARVTNLVRLIEQFKGRNIWVIGAASEATMEYTEWDWKLPVALFLGREGEGLHRLVREHCDQLVRIPVLGKVESLNVSVAAGVLLYEALRQRKGKR